MGVPRAATGKVATERLLCELCGDVIGAYEPLVVCNADGARTTSRAAEPNLGASDAAYHRDCYATRDDSADEATVDP